MRGELYILVTAARDEEEFIGQTLRSVVSQTVPPIQWIIVSDGSSDRTESIVQGYMPRHPFIRLLRREGRPQREFASKVEAIRFGLARMTPCTYRFIGILDADLSFDPQYFSEVLKMFSLDPGLGLAGGMYYESAGGRWYPLRTALAWSVAGGVQMFRRECYEAIGGYLPLRDGGVDTVAEVMARQVGWKTQTNPDLIVKHHRNGGTATGSTVRAGFMEGWRDFTVGYDPLFELAKGLNRIGQRPYVVRSACQIAGYSAAWIRTRRPVVTDSLVRFLRKEQRRRLISCLAGRVARSDWG